MKKLFISIICSLISAVMMCSVFTGCGASDNSGGKEYIIQYSDDSGIHSITVEEGSLYSIENVPERAGYEFLGLFDSPAGGIQYVNEKGFSLFAFSAGKNIVLYPQWRAKTYTVILDYQGAEVSYEKQFTVEYGSVLPDLPRNLSIAHSSFAGWYTEKNCGGICVADKNGLNTAFAVVNEANFDLSKQYIYLYAGFEIQKCSVTFRFGNSVSDETIQTEYATPVSEIVSKTRIDGKAVLKWTDTPSGGEFTGKITEDKILYPLEWAPVIDFDLNGGSGASTIVARAGSAVVLPTPTKNLSKFSHWEKDGERVQITVMPTESIVLKAVWNAAIVFDENGGTDVDDISAPEGTAIELPVPEKSGYMFAGWYTADKEQYVSDTMPAAGIELKAGWYAEKTAAKIIVDSKQYQFPNYYNSRVPEVLTEKLYIDLSEELPSGFYGEIALDVHINLKVGVTGHTFKLQYYSQEVMSSQYLLYTKSFNPTSKDFREYDYSMKFVLNGNKIYCSRYFTTNHNWCSVSDYYVNLKYPDTTKLYL